MTGVQTCALPISMITTPGHGSFPSGHGTEIFAAVTVLKALLGLTDTSLTGLQLDRLAARIATNRVIAGVHFPVDSVAGRLLGHQLAAFFLSASSEGKVQSGWTSRRFDADAFFNQTGQDFKPTVPIGATTYYPSMPPTKPTVWLATSIPVMRKMRSLAEAEWRGRKFA